MSTTVQAIIEGAYNRYSSNDPGKLAQDPELILHLSRVYERTWPLIARARPDQFHTETTVTLLGSPPAASLPADLIDVVAVYNADGDTVNLIPATDRNRLWILAPAVFRRGLQIVSRFAANDPVAGDALTLSLLEAPAPLTALAQTLDARWPVRQVQLLVDYLAMYLGTKDAGRSGADRSALAAELQMDVGAFAAEFGLAPEVVAWIHADAERASGETK